MPTLTKKQIILGVSFLGGLFALMLILIGITTIPGTIDTRLQKSLQIYGFQTENIEKIEKRWGAIRYHNLGFGQNEENSIDRLTVYFDLSGFFQKRLKRLEIDGLYLSGDIDIDNKVSIKGYEILPDFDAIKTSGVQNFQIKNINFSFLSAHFGGLRGTANITGQQDNGAQIWTGNIDSRQDQLELIAKFNGQLNESTKWFVDFEIENAKLERGWGKITRAHGNASWSGQSSRWEKLRADINAGGFIVHNTPWENASITIDNTPKTIKTIIAAKSAGLEELELNLDALYHDKALKWNATVHAPTFEQMLSYFTKVKMMPFSEEIFSDWRTEKEVSLLLSNKNKSLIFNVRNPMQEIDIKGKITPESTNLLKVLSVIPVSLTTKIPSAECKTKGVQQQAICSFHVQEIDGSYILAE